MSLQSIEDDDVFSSLGVRPFINCCSTRSVHGGSLMLPEVKARMDAASRRFVNMDELMAGARKRIAELTGAEDGAVTAGSAAAIAIATAAAMTGNDPVKMLRLPDTQGLANGVVMLKSHRFPYDQAIRMTGARIVEVETVEDLERLDPSNIAMAFYLGYRDGSDNISLEQLIAHFGPLGVPTLVDAASEHIMRPNPWLARGADLVVYSGGKFLRGPQTSGVVLGRSRLIDAIVAHSPPHRAFGRAMKIGKEDIVGIIAALEIWFAEGQDAKCAVWEADLLKIAAALAPIEGIAHELLPPDDGDLQPRLRLNWSPELFRLSAMQLRQLLLDGTPRIMLDDVSAKGNSVIIEPFSLQPGEAEIVGGAIAKALLQAGDIVAAANEASPAALDGKWVFSVAFAREPRVHHVEIAQLGNSLSGLQQSDGFAGPISGKVQGQHVELSFEMTYEAAIISYRFDGEMDGDTISGSVSLGSTTTGGRGEVSLGQYGRVAWTGRRL
jgi:L-seryl-tRNA(Ser) seleniumtransferase